MKLSSRQVLSLLILLLAIITILAVLVMYPIYGADIYYVFYPSARSFLEGRNLIYQAGTMGGFFNPPHALYYWLLLALSPLPVANALHMLLSLSFLAGTTHLWREFVKLDFLAIVLAIVNNNTLDHLIRGQMDILAVFGLVLAFAGAKKHLPYLLGIGLSLSMIKPTNILLPLLLIAWSLRSWLWRELFHAALIPLILLLSTFIVFDIGWPARFLERNHGFPELLQANLTIWKLSAAAQLPVTVPQILVAIMLLALLKYRNLTTENFALASTINFLVTPYAAAYHYVALVPALLCIHSRKWLILCCLLSFTSFLRIIAYDFSWLTMLYPVAICAGLLWQMWHDEKAKNKSLAAVNAAT